MKLLIRLTYLLEDAFILTGLIIYFLSLGLKTRIRGEEED